MPTRKVKVRICGDLVNEIRLFNDTWEHSLTYEYDSYDLRSNAPLTGRVEPPDTSILITSGLTDSIKINLL